MVVGRQLYSNKQNTKTKGANRPMEISHYADFT